MIKKLEKILEKPSKNFVLFLNCLCLSQQKHATLWRTMPVILRLLQLVITDCHVHAIWWQVLNHTLQLNSMSKTVEKIKNSSPDMMYVTEIREAVANVKSIVENFKRTGLNNKLPVLLKQSNEARWNSSLLMLKIFNEQRKNVESVLNESGQE